ncbi:MAG: triose-phosphate isomerase [Rhodobacterales bacterium]|nr:triose-phosphate isomerase [Rhodobacterales bacterium]
MARRPLIAGNWKMNGLKKDGRALAAGLAKLMKKEKKPAFEMLVCPPYPLIDRVVEAVKGSGIKVGGQDSHTAVSGAHTGDVSPAMLADLGCKYVILGHSERRTDHGEKDALVKAKAEAAIAAGLKVIVCVGETLAQREKGQTIAVNRRQVRGSLPDGADAKNTVIAYEPVWAIGTGLTATPEQAQEVHAEIRATLAGLIGGEADKMRILYGGSMKPGNAGELMAQPDIDGGLIGGAALKVEDFWGIAKSC